MLLVAVFVFGKRSCSFNGLTGIHGDGPTQTESRSITGFHAIDLGISGNVEASLGDYKVEVVAQGNLLPHIKTTVSDGTLVISFDESVSSSKDIIVRVSAPAFDGFSVSGSGEIKVNGPVQADNLKVAIGGSGAVNIPQVSADKFDLSLSGSGELLMGGKVNTGKLSISGSGDVKAKSLEFNELTTDVSGSGSVWTHVNTLLKASVSGSGDVYYTGEPKVEASVSGSGTVLKM